MRPKTNEEAWVRTLVPREIHRALRVLAAQQSTSMAAVVCQILTDAIKAAERTAAK